MRVGGTSSPHPSLETQLTVIIAGGNFNRSGSYRHKAPPLSFPALGMDSLPPSLPIVHTRTKTWLSPSSKKARGSLWQCANHSGRSYRGGGRGGGSQCTGFKVTVGGAKGHQSASR